MPVPFKNLKPSTLAFVSYLVAAALPVATWATLFLTAMPEQLSLQQSVISQLIHTFSVENPHRWWFVTWASAPVVLLVLAANYFRGPPRPQWWAGALLVLGAAIGIASTYLWPSLFLPTALGVYFAYRARNQT